jgi:hypothetical protein
MAQSLAAITRDASDAIDNCAKLRIRSIAGNRGKVGKAYGKVEFDLRLTTVLPIEQR